MKKFCAGAAAVSVAMLAFGGTAWAAPKPPKPKAPKPNETITITIDASAPNGPSPVTATGVFNGSGSDTRTARVAGKTDHARDVLTFDEGTVTVKDVGVRSVKLDKTTCTRSLKEKGVWKIVKGTGSFVHTKGHGHYKAVGTIQGTAGTNGCDFSAPTGSITVTATGRVKG
jgi:hypothetical protein